MKTNNYLFICCGPYQLLNSIHYIYSIDNSAQNDLILLNMNLDQSFIEKLIDSRLFRRVYIVCHLDVSLNWKRKIDVAKKMLFVKNMIISYIPEFDFSIEYNLLVSSTYLTDLTTLFMNYYSAAGIEMDMIEDGTGLYIEGPALWTQTHIYIAKVFQKWYPPLKIRRIWAYQPELVLFKTYAKISKFPKMSRTGKENKLLRSLLSGYNCNISQPFIFLSDGIGCPVPQKDLMLQVLDEIIRSVGREKVIIKDHPHNEVKYPDDVVTLEKSLPWEWYYILNEFNNKTIISGYSGAAITPKLVFDEEPKVIFINRLYENLTDKRSDVKQLYKGFSKDYKEILKGYDALFRGVGSIYNKESVFMPEDIESLIEALSDSIY